MTNNENELRKFIVDSAKRDKLIHLLDIVDELKPCLGQHPELASRVTEKPYDMGILYKGKYVAIELKNENKYLSFNLSAIEAHQIKYLKEAVKCGGLAFVLVRFKKGLSASEKKRLAKKDNYVDKTYALGIQWIGKQKETSLSIEFIQEECLEIPFNEVSKEYNLRVLWPTKQKK